MEQPQYLIDSNSVIDFLSKKLPEKGIVFMNNVIELRKKNKTKLPDAIIAATALELGLTLITRNIGDFKNIPNLKSINPWDL
jgi:predicted nucleic acid-binding protein